MVDTSASNNIAAEFIKKQQLMLDEHAGTVKLKPKRGTSVRAKTPRRPIVIENSPMKLQPRRIRSSSAKSKSKRPIVIHNSPERQKAHGMITRSMAKRPIAIEKTKADKPVRGILRKTSAPARPILPSSTSVRVVPPSSKRGSIYRAPKQTQRTVRSHQTRQTVRSHQRRTTRKPQTRQTVRKQTQRIKSQKRQTQRLASKKGPAMYIAVAPGHPKKNSGANIMFNNHSRKPKASTPIEAEPVYVYKKRSPSNFSKMVDGKPSSHVHWHSLGDHRPFCQRLEALSKQVPRSQFNAILREFHSRIVLEIDKHVSDCSREPMCALGLKAINGAFRTAIDSKTHDLIHDIHLYCDALRSNHNKLFFTKKYLEPHVNALLEAAVFEIIG